MSKAKLEIWGKKKTGEYDDSKGKQSHNREVARK
jgi:hypothetical protein